MTKIMEEKRIMEQQKLENEQNQTAAIKTELVKRRSTFRSMPSLESVLGPAEAAELRAYKEPETSSAAPTTPSQAKKYSKWPSLGEIQELKRKLQVHTAIPLRVRKIDFSITRHFVR